MNEKSIKEELERMGYWKEMYDKPNVFGTGQTKFADISLEIIKNENVKTILELGCGQGRDTLFFSQNKFDILATDFSENAVKFVKESAEDMNQKNVRTRVLDMRDKFDVENQFDCVYSNLALQFFNEEELGNIFQKISNILNPNGMFLFSTKMPGDKYHKAGKKIDENAYNTNGITRYFFESEIIKKLLKNYFDVSNIGNEKHVNLDDSISAWWYFICKKI